MNWHRSHHRAPRSASPSPPPPQPPNPSIIPVKWYLSVRITVLWGEIHGETEMKGFLLKRAGTECLWLTPNRFSLDDSWARTGSASLPEAQRPWAGCHAQAMSLSLGHGAFLLGGSTVGRVWQPWLIHALPPTSNKLVKGWARQTEGQRCLFFF